MPKWRSKGNGCEIMSRSTYIFLDESGNLDFSASGTHYFVLTSVSTRRPFAWFSSLDDFKYDCLEYGLENESFHCATDNRYVRAKLFDIIGRHLDGLYIDSLIVEKRKTDPVLRADKRFYPEMMGYLLKYVLPREPNARAKEVIVITDTVPLNKKRQSIEKAVKLTLAKMLPPGQRYRIMHHDSRSHYGLQIADYCCWAVFRRCERGESDYYERIHPAVRSGFDIFRTGKEYYY